MGSLFSRGPPAGPTSSTEGSAFAPCARMRPRQLQPAYESLGWRAVDGAHPLVYSDVYNVTFYGVEKLHPFDSCKARSHQHWHGTLVPAAHTHRTLIPRRRHCSTGASSATSCGGVSSPETAC